MYTDTPSVSSQVDVYDVLTLPKGKYLTSNKSSYTLAEEVTGGYQYEGLLNTTNNNVRPSNNNKLSCFSWCFMTYVFLLVELV